MCVRVKKSGVERIRSHIVTEPTPSRGYSQCSVVIWVQVQAFMVPKWLVEASPWAIAALRDSESIPDCLQEVRRAASVCVGFGDEVLRERQFLWAFIFLGGFAAGAAAAFLVVGLVRLRDLVLRVLVACCRRCFPAAERSSIEATLAEFAATSQILNEPGYLSPKRSEDGAKRESRFKGAGAVRR